MPKADQFPATRRRFIGGATTALLAAVASPAAAHSDAELLALCAQFEALQNKANGLWSWRKGDLNVRGPDFIEDDDEREIALEPIEAALDPVLDRICAIVPTTPAGFRAVARCLLLWDGVSLVAVEQDDDQDGCVNERLSVCLLRGLTAGEELRPVWFLEA